MNITDVFWFSGRDCIGIVKVKTETEIKYYIGKALGTTEDQDAMFIAKNGSKFPFEAGEALFGTE